MNVTGIGRNIGGVAPAAAESVAAKRPSPVAETPRGLTVGTALGASEEDEILRGIDLPALEGALSGNEPLDRLIDRAFGSEGLAAPAMPPFAE